MFCKPTCLATRSFFLSGLFVLVNASLPTSAAQDFCCAPFLSYLSSYFSCCQPDNPQTTRNKELLSAAEDGNLKKVHAALQAGAEINCSDDNGVTPLMHAIAMNHMDIATHLLDTEGININQRDHGGLSAFVIALCSGNTEGIKLLLKHNVDINDLNNGNGTALTGMIEMGNNNMVKLLLSMPRIDVEKRHDDTITPLMAATIAENQTAVALLLLANANRSSQDRLGNTALRYANNRYIKRLLQTKSDKELIAILEQEDRINCQQMLQERALLTGNLHIAQRAHTLFGDAIFLQEFLLKNPRASTQLKQQRSAEEKHAVAQSMAPKLVFRPSITQLKPQGQTAAEIPSSIPSEGARLRYIHTK